MPIDNKIAQLVSALEQECQEGDVYLSSAVQAVIETVPILGSTLTKILGEQRARNIFSRFTEILTEFGRDIERLGESKLDKGALHSQEFQSIFSMVIRELQFTEEKEKLQFFKNILVHSVSTDTAQSEQKKTYLRLVIELQTEHILALKRICAKFPVSGKGHIGEFQALMAPWDPDRTRRVCNDLARFWLLNEMPAFTDTYDHNYQVTRHATYFLRFIIDDGKLVLCRE